MAFEPGNGTTTQLLTLLNVSATKVGKRKWILDDVRPTHKLNKRRTVQFSDETESKQVRGDGTREETVVENQSGPEPENEVNEVEDEGNVEGPAQGMR